jgi:hypothetical protein
MSKRLWLLLFIFVAAALSVLFALAMGFLVRHCDGVWCLGNLGAQ